MRHSSWPEGAAGAGGQHQVVVATGLAVENDLLAFRVDVGHLSEKHLNIALFADQLSQWGGDVTAGNEPGGHLIQQRLEQIEIALVDQGDAHIGLGQSLAGMHAGEAAAHNHHMRSMAQAFLWGLQLQEKVIAGHQAFEQICPEVMQQILVCRCR